MSEFLDVLGPRIQHLTELSDDQTYCVMKGEIGPGVIVPIRNISLLLTRRGRSRWGQPLFTSSSRHLLV